MEYKAILDIVEKPVSGEWGIEPSNGSVIKVLRNTNFRNDGSLNLKDVVEREIPTAKIAQKKLNYGDILIEKSGGSSAQPVGRVVFFDQKEEQYLFSNFTSSLRPKNGIFSKYLFYLLYGNHLFKKTLAFQNKTTGILNLQLNRYLKETKIPVPTIIEQQRIATILDHADSIRRKNKQILQKYDELAQSVFYEMFGDPGHNVNNWDIIELSYLCNKITDGTHKTPKYSESGIIFLSAKNIKERYLTDTDIKYITTIEHEALIRRCKPEPGDILLTKSGSTGMAALISFNYEFSIFESLALIKFKKDLINGKFLWMILNLPSTLIQYNGMTKGIGIKHLHLEDIKKIKIILPPISLQNQYSLLIEKVENQIKLAKKSLLKSEELFQSLLQRAFKGEL